MSGITSAADRRQFCLGELLLELIHVYRTDVFDDFLGCQSQLVPHDWLAQLLLCFLGERLQVEGLFDEPNEQEDVDHGNHQAGQGPQQTRCSRLAQGGLQVSQAVLRLLQPGPNVVPSFGHLPISSHQSV
ncbi:MAG: hypothetical protein ACYS8L_05445 [Planctomycetota bacterium]|jgi:hypothetical protein